jgi:hypothetical protein
MATLGYLGGVIESVGQLDFTSTFIGGIPVGIDSFTVKMQRIRETNLIMQDQ